MYGSRQSERHCTLKCAEIEVIRRPAMNGGRVEIPGSAPLHSGDGERSGVSPGQQLTATILLRRRPGAADTGEQLLSGSFEPISRDAAAEQIGADPQDLQAVESFAREYGLTITSVNPAARTVKVEGTVTDFNRAFRNRPQFVWQLRQLQRADYGARVARGRRSSGAWA